MKRNKVIYLHIAKEDFETNGKFFQKDQIVYVGSGDAIRSFSKNNRMPYHLEVWDKLSFNIILQGLTLKESERYEQKMVLKYWDKGLLNIKRKVDVKKDYIYDELSKIFYLDNDYNLLFKILPRNGVRPLKPTSKKYRQVTYCGAKYQLHRLIWVLYNKKDAPHDMVVDHIDRNSRNNHPSNLRLFSYSSNSRNKEYRNDSSDMRYIYFSKKKLIYRVRIKILDNHTFTEIKVKWFPLKSLIKTGYSEEEAKIIQLQKAKEYRDSVVKDI